MAHNLMRNRMAFVGETPWHGLGKAVPPNIAADEMMEAAGLDWEVSKVPAPGARITNNAKALHDRYLVMRKRLPGETSDVALGMVGPKYEPLQNRDAFGFFQPLVENNYANFHTAGALGNGERVWVLARLNQDILIGKDDTVERYLLLSNSHDGSGAVTVRFTPIRVVCQNTLSFALAKGSGSIAVEAVRHSKHVVRNLEKAQTEKLRSIIDKTFRDAQNIFGQMALRKIGAESLVRFLEIVAPRTEKQRKAGIESERWLRIRSILEDRSVTPRETAGTLWALYNALVRDEDYRTTRESEPSARLERVWFGDGHALKLKALNAARELLALKDVA